MTLSDQMSRILPSGIVLLFLLLNNNANAQTQHPNIYATQKDRTAILDKIKTAPWASDAWKRLLLSIDKYADRHESDPEWIVSRMAMNWKDGSRYTQCYLKNETWDYGTGNAPVPTVRMPGMRVWNEYLNVPLEDRTPYNETGDMKAVSRAHPEAGVVVVPYKKSGHLIRGNNNDILTLGEKAAFAYWLTREEKYAKFAADIFNTWLVGTYYMNPILDPGKSSGGPGGYEPGGILGYYDYEQIHDDLSTHTAVIYDFMEGYLNSHSTKEIGATGKSLKEIAGIVFKRFVDIGMVRGGRKGNWNINGWEMIMPAMLVLESDSFYADHHGKEYYLKFYTTTSTPYHDALPDILKDFDPVTGLWSESPGYASNTIISLLNMALPIYKSGVNTVAGNPMMQKAALVVFPWLDARGNLVVFGDSRGGPWSFNGFENLLTYYSWVNDKKNTGLVASAIEMGLKAKQYDRSNADWKGLCLNMAQLPVSNAQLGYARTAYSPVHRHIIMKNGNDVENGMMFTLYGGYPKQKHLSPNGLAMQLYGKGWALAPDAAGYESYWSKDYSYHQTATGSNTILPGYTAGPVKINAMEPSTDSLSYTAAKAISPYCSFADMSAGEKRRTVAMIRTSGTTGYYIDIFRSDQLNNDYLYHNLGNELTVKDATGKILMLEPASLDSAYNIGYSYFKNPLKSAVSTDINATWTINRTQPGIVMDMWMKGEAGREIFKLDAPYTNLNSVVSPVNVNIAPETTPSIIVRQNNVNGWKRPFVAVFEPHNTDEKSIESIKSLTDNGNFNALSIHNKTKDGESTQYIVNAVDDQLYHVGKDIGFSGTFGVIAENAFGLQYLYLGKGKLLQKGSYKVEAGDAISFGLINQNGQLSYSASGNAGLTIPAPGTLKAKMPKVYYKINGVYEEADSKYNKTDKTITVQLSAGYDIAIKIK